MSADLENATGSPRLLLNGDITSLTDSTTLTWRVAVVGLWDRYARYWTAATCIFKRSCGFSAVRLTSGGSGGGGGSPLLFYAASGIALFETRHYFLGKQLHAPAGAGQWRAR